jgi:hypothetical protein
MHSGTQPPLDLSETGIIDDFRPLCRLPPSPSSRHLRMSRSSKDRKMIESEATFLPLPSFASLRTRTRRRGGAAQLGAEAPALPCLAFRVGCSLSYQVSAWQHLHISVLFEQPCLPLAFLSVSVQVCQTSKCISPKPRCDLILSSKPHYDQTPTPQQI